MEREKKTGGTKQRVPGVRWNVTEWNRRQKTDILLSFPAEWPEGVMIASASAEKPRLIIADEPTPGLDARAAKRILGHFRELADEGAGILFITHDLELALAIADRGGSLFMPGETIEEADAADFSDASGLRHPFTKALWNAHAGTWIRACSRGAALPGTGGDRMPFFRPVREMPAGVPFL